MTRWAVEITAVAPLALVYDGLHGASLKRLAPPRNTKDRDHQQPKLTTANRHKSQTKH